MKTTAALLGLLATASAATIQHAKVNYDGFKVFRVATVDEDAATHLQKVTEQLGLQKWETSFKAGSYNDLAVPPAQLAKFNELIGDMKSTVMHENLGESIAHEGSFPTYAGEF